jgi:DNA polymerase delta subunit 1
MEFPRKEIGIIEYGKELKFQITDWYIPESDRTRDKPETPDIYSILIYGVTNNGESVSVNVKGYEPYFYVKPPDEWELYSDKRFNTEVGNLELKLRNDKYECIFKKNGNESKYKKKIISVDYCEHFNGLSMVKKQDFWGFTNNKEFRFIKVSVKSLNLFNSLKYYFGSLKKEGFKLYESNIDPFLRYIHEQDIKPCGWVSITDYEEYDNETRSDYSIETYYKNINPIEINNIAPLLIASFDIECTSSHGDFPVSQKDYKKVAQDLVNVVKAGYSIDEEYISYWLENIFIDDVIIDENLTINKVYTKNSVNIEKINVSILKIRKSVIELLNKISEMSSTIDDENDDEEDDNENTKAKKSTVKEYNIIESELNNVLSSALPKLEGDKIIQIGTTVHKYGSDAIIYKNIISLNSCDDIEDVDVISCNSESKLLMEWKKLMMRLNPDVLIGYNIYGFDMEYVWNRCIENNIKDDFAFGLGRKINRKSSLIKQELSSSALGENILKYFDMDGIVTIDLFKVMQREQKLDSYKLDNVASIFLGDKKDDLKPQEIFAKFKGTSADRCVIAKYCIQDCALVNRLLHKLKILENNIGMGNVCLVPLNYLFRRGQGIKIFSLIAKKCMDKGQLIPVLRSYGEISDIDLEGYEGAVVLEPIEGIYLNDPIVVFDYGSLYPSSMIERNLSHDCYIIDDKYKVEDPNIEYIDVAYDLYEGIGDKKTKKGEKICTFAKYKDGRKGIIAEILCMLLEERKNTRKKIEYKTFHLDDSSEIYGFVSKENDDEYEIINIELNTKKLINKKNIVEIKNTFNKFEQDVFDALQSAYKVTANSLYGQIGARTSPIYLKEIAACTTATGREMIMKAKKYVETNYNAVVIYGDTDSIFCKFPTKDSEGNEIQGKDALKFAIEIGKDVEKNISSIMPYPQKLNYEKTMYPFILLSKKRYVGNLYENDITKFKQKSMGIVLKRRDNAMIVKKIYGGVIDILLNSQDLNESIEFLKGRLDDLVNGKICLTDLVISKSLRASYKDATKIAHKVLADRMGARDPGNKPAVNDRIPYIYIKVPDANVKLQGDRIENPEYIVQNNITPDYLHYITNQIMKPILQLYALCLDELPNYSKDDKYWDDMTEELKMKPMYQNETRLKNRIDNLKLNMVKELLFDEFINVLSEPKIKKPRKTITKGIIQIGDNVVQPKPKVVRAKAKPKDKTISIVDTNVASTENSEYSADIKITKKKDSDIIAVAKIKKNSKIIWNYNNDNCVNKSSEIKSIIRDMVSYMTEYENSKKIKIKINNKTFISDYNKVLIHYYEFKKCELNNNNLVENALITNDIGVLKNRNKIIEYEELISINDMFELVL